ncbi:MAG: nonstructural protein [Microviridae sp.]|nr:MAG: nonstructural protein [Microviridae sp.]
MTKSWVIFVLLFLIRFKFSAVLVLSMLVVLQCLMLILMRLTVFNRFLLRSVVNMNIYIVRDVKAGAFNNPFVQQSDGAAIRSFQQEVNRVDTNNMINLYPADFSLYRTGSYDPDLGVISALSQPDLVVEAVSLVIS